MKESTYKPKSLIDGYKLGDKTGVQYIAIPEKKAPIRVIYKDETMLINDLQSALQTRQFKDRFGRNPYTLYYFEWNPDTQQQKLI